LEGTKLKKEKEQAVIALLEEKEIFAVLTTGFGKQTINLILKLLFCPTMKTNFELWLWVF